MVRTHHCHRPQLFPESRLPSRFLDQTWERREAGGADSQAVGRRQRISTSRRFPLCSRITRYGGGATAGKKDYDATKNLPANEPAQVLPKGTKTGLPKRKDVFRALDKIAKKPTAK